MKKYFYILTVLGHFMNVVGASDCQDNLERSSFLVKLFQQSYQPLCEHLPFQDQMQLSQTCKDLRNFFQGMWSQNFLKNMNSLNWLTLEEEKHFQSIPSFLKFYSFLNDKVKSELGKLILKIGYKSEDIDFKAKKNFIFLDYLLIDFFSKSINKDIVGLINDQMRFQAEREYKNVNLLKTECAILLSPIFLLEGKKREATIEHMDRETEFSWESFSFIKSKMQLYSCFLILGPCLKENSCRLDLDLKGLNNLFFLMNKNMLKYDNLPIEGLILKNCYIKRGWLLSLPLSLKSFTLNDGYVGEQEGLKALGEELQYCPDLSTLIFKDVDIDNDAWQSSLWDKWSQNSPILEEDVKADPWYQFLKKLKKDNKNLIRISFNFKNPLWEEIQNEMLMLLNDDFGFTPNDYKRYFW